MWRGVTRANGEIVDPGTLALVLWLAEHKQPTRHFPDPIGLLCRNTARHFSTYGVLKGPDRILTTSVLRRNHDAGHYPVVKDRQIKLLGPVSRRHRILSSSVSVDINVNLPVLGRNYYASSQIFVGLSGSISAEIPQGIKGQRRTPGPYGKAIRKNLIFNLSCLGLGARSSSEDTEFCTMRVVEFYISIRFRQGFAHLELGIIRQ